MSSRPPGEYTLVGFSVDALWPAGRAAARRRVNAKTISTTRPNTTPAATTSSPSRARPACGWVILSRMTVPSSTKMAPDMTVTAATTDRVMTRRILLAATVRERTA
jgi:hypothetical protein